MTVTGYLHADDPGELIIETGETMETTLVIDGSVVEPSGPSRHQVALERGRHFVQVKSHLTGNRWTFVPLWNGSPIGTHGLRGGDDGDSVGVGSRGFAARCRC